MSQELNERLAELVAVAEGLPQETQGALAVLIDALTALLRPQAKG